MTSIPSNLARVPNLLRSGLFLSNFNRTNVQMLRVQQQIATGRDILRPGDDIVRAATIAVLDDRLERSDQLKRNYSHATAALNVLDNALGEAHDAALQAKSIASSQINPSASSDERAAQATVIDSILAGLMNTANRQSVAGYIFGGGLTTVPPVQEFLGGYRYMGSGPGLVTDLGTSSSIPITLGNGNPLISSSARVKGNVDLNPVLTPDTRLADVRGARGLGVTLGVVRFSVNGGALQDLDLSGADTVADITTRLNNALHAYEASSGTTVLGPGGVSTSGDTIHMDVASGVSVEFQDVASGVCAQDLGLARTPAAPFTDANPDGVGLNPRLTFRSAIGALAGLAGPLGSIRLSNAGRSVNVDLSGARTLADVRNAIEGAGLGLRVSIGSDDTLQVMTDVASGSAQAMSIAEVAGNGSTATLLGIRSFTADTRVSDLNFGRGVDIVDGKIDPVSGGATRALNTDLRITMGDGRTVDVDLRPQDMTSVQTVMDRINSEIASAGVSVTDLVAGLSDGANGIVLRQNPSLGGDIRVEALNNSPAGEQLGLTGGTYDAASARLVGEDRAKIRPQGLFTNLIDLRDALRNNDPRGITLAGEDLDATIRALSESRGMVGGLSQRVDAANVRETDRANLDLQTRSELRDTDFAAAASRLTLLQTQLQAGLQTAASTYSLSLLDFLG